MSIDTDVPADATDDLERLSQELGDAIADLPEYQAFVEAKEAVENDDDAQQRIEEFEQQRQAYLQAKQANRASQADLAALQDAQAELHDMPVMDEFLQAQSALERRLKRANALISEPLAIDFGEKAGGCCQD